jgi:hypothetical protein
MQKQTTQKKIALLLQIKQHLSRRAWFLALLPIFFILSGYNELFGFLKFSFVTINFLVLVLCLSVLLLLGKLLLKQTEKATLFTFFSGAYLLLFGFISDSIKKIIGHASFFNSYQFWLPFTVVLFLVLFIWLKKTTKQFEYTFFYLNTLMIALVVSEIPNSVKRYQLDKAVHNLIDFRFKAAEEYKRSTPVLDSAKPDIYFLLFDALASTKSIQKSLNKDNSQLDSVLKRRKFYVIPNGSSNYNWTIHSLSTTFNMEYLPDFIAPVMNDPKSYFWGTNSILNNSLTQILTSEGYQIFQYQPISFNNNDWPLETYFHELKDKHFFFKTLPGRIYRDIFWNYTRINSNVIKNIQVTLANERIKKRKQSLDTTLSLIKKTCSATGRTKFVYGHFMLPHDPYIFTRTGSIKWKTKENLGEKIPEDSLYFAQLSYANIVIEEIVNYIQINNKKNTVVIVAGDHGYRIYKDERIQNAMQNFNAFYFPDGDYKLLYDSLTPVNTFRIVLNKYFKAGLPLLKDSSVIVGAGDEVIIKEKMKEKTP